MAASHRWRFQAVCPGCGAADDISVVEDAEPPFTDHPRREYVSKAGRFAVLGAVPARLQCVACSLVFAAPV